MTEKRRRRFSLGSAGAAVLRGGGEGYNGSQRRGSMPIAEIESPSIFRKGSLFPSTFQSSSPSSYFHRHQMGRIVRIVVAGEKSVGKTAILQQAAYGINIIGDRYIPTIEDNYSLAVELDRGNREIVHCVDTAGLDSTNPELLRHYFQIADAFILIFSLESVESFGRVDALKKEFERNFRAEKKEVPPIVVLANKMDSPKRQIDSEICQSWSQKERTKVFECSATDRKSLIEPFVYIASKIFASSKDNKFTLGKKSGKDKQPGAAILMDL